MTNSHHGNYKFHTWIFGKFSGYLLLFVFFKRRACQKLKHRGKDRKIDNSKLQEIFTVTYAAFIRRISGLCFWFTYWSWQRLGDFWFHSSGHMLFIFTWAASFLDWFFWNWTSCGGIIIIFLAYQDTLIE